MLVEKWETQQMVAWDVYHTLLLQVDQKHMQLSLTSGRQEGTPQQGVVHCKWQEQHLILCEAIHRLSSREKNMWRLIGRRERQRRQREVRNIESAVTLKKRPLEDASTKGHNTEWGTIHNFEDQKQMLPV